jgi:hypothetical protein
MIWWLYIIVNKPESYSTANIEYISFKKYIIPEIFENRELILQSRHKDVLQPEKNVEWCVFCIISLASLCCD